MENTVNTTSPKCACVEAISRVVKQRSLSRWSKLHLRFPLLAFPHKRQTLIRLDACRDLSRSFLNPTAPDTCELIIEFSSSTSNFSTIFVIRAMCNDAEIGNLKIKNYQNQKLFASTFADVNATAFIFVAMQHDTNLIRIDVDVTAFKCLYYSEHLDKNKNLNITNITIIV